MHLPLDDRYDMFICTSVYAWRAGTYSFQVDVGWSPTVASRFSPEEKRVRTIA